MKQFSTEPYYVVGLVGDGCRKHSESRFATERGAMRHAKRLVRAIACGEDRTVFVDRVRVAGVHTHHREEEGTNRVRYVEVDVRGRVWVWDGIGNWEHQTMV